MYSSSKTLDERAEQQLFQAFSQRGRLWDVCVPMLLYAGMLQSAKKSFPEVKLVPKRKAFFFYLPEWNVLGKQGEATTRDERTPLRTMVRVLPQNENGPDTFVVASFINSRKLRDDLHEWAQPVVLALRAKRLKRSLRVKDETGRVTLRVDRTESEEDVKRLLSCHLEDLRAAFRHSGNVPHQDADSAT